jgi:hypothetical protein
MTDIADMFPMFDRTAPRRSGELVGESFAKTIQSSACYSRLDPVRDAELLTRLQDCVRATVRSVAENSLPGLGFDARSIDVYQTAAIKAFRDALPASNGSAMVH